MPYQGLLGQERVKIARTFQRESTHGTLGNCAHRFCHDFARQSDHLRGIFDQIGVVESQAVSYRRPSGHLQSNTACKQVMCSSDISGNDASSVIQDIQQVGIVRYESVEFHLRVGVSHLRNASLQEVLVRVHGVVQLSDSGKASRLGSAVTGTGAHQEDQHQGE